MGWFAILSVLAPPGNVTAAGPLSGTPPVVVERRLNNGMTVVIEEDHGAPLVALVLRYDAGERRVPPGRSGLAALTTQFMLHASRHVPAGDYERLLELAGSSSFRYQTTTDASVLEVTVPSSRVELPLWLWSDQMGFFTGGDGANLAERKAVFEERRREDTEGPPIGQLDTFVDEELLPRNHIYRNAMRSPPRTFASSTAIP